MGPHRRLYRSTAQIGDSQLERHVPGWWSNGSPSYSFFKSECLADKNAAKHIETGEGSHCRNRNVRDNLELVTMKLCVLYLQFVMSAFDKVNLLFQQDEPLIHKQRGYLLRLVRELLVMFVKPAAFSNKVVTEVDFKSHLNIKKKQ